MFSSVCPRSNDHKKKKISAEYYDADACGTPEDPDSRSAVRDGLHQNDGGQRRLGRLALGRPAIDRRAASIQLLENGATEDLSCVEKLDRKLIDELGLGSRVNAELKGAETGSKQKRIDNCRRHRRKKSPFLRIRRKEKGNNNRSNVFGKPGDEVRHWLRHPGMEVDDRPSALKELPLPPLIPRTPHHPNRN